MGAFCNETEVLCAAGVPMSTFEEVLDRLRKRRAEAAKLLADIDAAIEALPRIRALAEADLFDEAEVALGQFFPHPSVDSGDSESQKDALSPHEVARVARETLLEVGRPLKRGALVKAIEKRGFVVPGKDKSKNLGTILWRHDREFVNLEKFGYWPRDKELRGAYDPANPPDGKLYESPT